MVKFTDSNGKDFAVNKAAVQFIRDTSTNNHGVVTDSVVIYVGGTSFTVLDSLANVMGDLA